MKKRKKEHFLLVLLKNILTSALSIILTIALLYFFISDNVRTDEIKKIERIENSIVDSYDRLNDVVEVPSITNQREIFYQLYGEDWVKTLKSEMDILDIKRYPDREKEITVTVNMKDYGSVYLNAKNKTDKYIKENKGISKREKNDYLIKAIKEEVKNIEYTKITFDASVHNIRTGRMTGVHLKISLGDEEKNESLYNALTGGLVYAMKENPCDYLIVSDEFKYYEELKGLIEDVKTDIVKGDMPSEYKESRKVMSAFADPTGDKEKDIEVAFRSVGFSIEEIDRDKQKIKLIFDSPDYEKIYNKALKETTKEIESEEKYLTEGEKGEIFTENLYRNYVDMSTKTRVDPKKKTTITYETYYDENGECHYKLNIDDDFYSYFFGNLEKAVGSETDYMVFEREKPPEKKKGPDIVKEMMEEEEKNK